MAKERTEEEKAERKAASKERKAAKKEALKTVLNFVNERKNVPDEVKEAVKMVTPGQRVGGFGGGGPKKLDLFADFFTANAEASEMELFQQFKAGRAEMRKVTTQLIKKRKPEDRIWVRFDADSERYVVEGIGPDAPSGWTGYTPIEVEEEEIV